jgi:PEP-CTERM motif
MANPAAGDTPMRTHHRTLIALAAAAALLPGLASASVFGSLGNFDVVNDTGHDAHGFEIELEGLHLEDITDTFGGAGRGFPTTVERYGAPIVSEYNHGGSFGVHVTYQATFANGAWDVGTPSGVFTTPGESCWTGGGINYGPSTPCDHFGVGTVGNPTKTTYSWLVEAAPGSATLNHVVSSVPAAVWSVTPQPGLPDAPPIVVAQIRAPAPAESPEPQFGTPIWVKVYTTEYESKVALEDLLGGAPKIEATEVEMEWQLLQTDPGNPLSGMLENGGLAPVGHGAESVVRRYEFYKYTGALKAEDNEALPMFGDSHADASEVGDFIGAQNAAININGPLVAVPEPATWASMGLGLLLIGAARLRRTAVGSRRAR